MSRGILSVALTPQFKAVGDIISNYKNTWKNLKANILGIIFFIIWNIFLRQKFGPVSRQLPAC
jgi:hypothetical protein